VSINFVDQASAANHYTAAHHHEIGYGVQYCKNYQVNLTIYNMHYNDSNNTDEID